VQTILGLILLVVLYVLFQFLKEIWNEWAGAPIRWARGEPLRASEYYAARNADLLRALEMSGRRVRYRDRYREVRDAVLARDNYTCALCGKKPKRRGGLHLDHIRPRSTHPHLDLDPANLQALCASCNRHKHDYDGDDWRDVTLARKREARRRKARKSPSA
jgi:hypothetical protein